MKKYAVPENYASMMISSPDFYEFDEGYIWLNRGKISQLCCNSVLPHWSNAFRLRLLKIIRSEKCAIVAKSTDQKVIDLCVKSGGKLINEDTVAWNV